ncbi:GGDEF domain-containing protein [Caminibacter sp.]
MEKIFKSVIKDNGDGFEIEGDLEISKEDFEKIKQSECSEIEINGEKYWVLKKGRYYIIDKFECLERLKENAIYDPLTGCYNKREIIEFLNKFLNSYVRYKSSPFSVLMFDIDHFKKINDTYGHLAGDFVLRELAKLVKSLMRKSDLCGRFGGEEFIIILPETKLVGAMRFANRLRETVEKYDFIFNKIKIPVTISIGITSASINDSVESLLSRVDEALYEAKKKGRNRVEYR